MILEIRQTEYLSQSFTDIGKTSGAICQAIWKAIDTGKKKSRLADQSRSIFPAQCSVKQTVFYHLQRAKGAVCFGFWLWHERFATSPFLSLCS